MFPLESHRYALKENWGTVITVPSKLDWWFDMANRVWVVTGTSSGIGLAIAKHALSQGDSVSAVVYSKILRAPHTAQVIATVRSLAKFPAVLNEAGARPLVLDLDSSDDSVQRAAEEAIHIYGHVDVLVNNAGNNTTGYGPVEEVRYVKHQLSLVIYTSMMTFREAC